MLSVPTVTGIRPLSFEPGAEPLVIDVPGLTGVELYQHQILAVNRLVDLIDAGKVSTPDGIEIVSNAFMLSLDMGAGKTFIVIATYLLRRDPPPRPQQLFTPMYSRITRKLAGKYVKLRCSVIVVAKHILFQWAETLKEHTSLNVFLLYDAHRLREFIELLRTGDINNFDIILVKTDPVAGYGFGIPGEPESQQTRGMIDALGALLRNYLVPWAIYDDFDTAGLDKRTMMINASRTLLISATSDHAEALEKNPYREPTFDKSDKESMFVYLGAKNQTILNSPHDPHLSGPLNVRVSAASIKQSRDLPKVITYHYVHTCADADMIRLVAALGCDADVLEMLNGEAPAQAASNLNIVADSVTTLFEKLLGSAHENYAIADRRHKIYTNLMDSGIWSLLKKHPFKKYQESHVNAIIKRLDNMEEPPELLQYRLLDAQLQENVEDDTIMEQYEEALDELQRAYVNAVTTSKKPADPHITNFWSCAELEARIRTRIGEIVDEKSSIGKAIDNVRANFRQGVCGVCKKPHAANRQLYINKCCSIICCVDCGITANRFDRTYYYKTRKPELIGSCPGCLKTIRPMENMLFIEDIDILHILEGVAIEEKPKKPAPVKKEKEPAQEDEFDVKLKQIQSNKCRTLVRILKGRPAKSDDQSATCERRDRVYHKAIEGSEFKEIPEGHPRKALVFARYEETLAKATAAMKLMDIKYEIVAGTTREIADTLRRFNNDPSISVLIMHTRNCGGLNLDIATDIIFMHYIIDSSILSQAVGRAQRMGKHRQYSLNVHMLLMENERDL